MFEKLIKLIILYAMICRAWNMHQISLSVQINKYRVIMTYTKAKSTVNVLIIEFQPSHPIFSLI